MDGPNLALLFAGRATAVLASSARPDAPTLEQRDPQVHGLRWWALVRRVRRAGGIEPVAGARPAFHPHRSGRTG